MREGVSPGLEERQHLGLHLGSRVEVRRDDTRYEKLCEVSGADTLEKLWSTVLDTGLNHCQSEEGRLGRLSRCLLQPSEAVL